MYDTLIVTDTVPQCEIYSTTKDKGLHLIIFIANSDGNLHHNYSITLEENKLRGKITAKIC
jgi:hypothetical protein